MPFLSPPTKNAMPSTSTLFARIEPTSAAWTTVTSPSFSAKSATNSSGRLPSADWTTPAPPEPSREPSCSVAPPTSPRERGERDRGDDERRDVAEREMAERCDCDEDERDERARGGRGGSQARRR